MKKIVMHIFPNVEELDFVKVFEVLAKACSMHGFSIINKGHKRLEDSVERKITNSCYVCAKSYLLQFSQETFSC